MNAKLSRGDQYDIPRLTYIRLKAVELKAEDKDLEK